MTHWVTIAAITISYIRYIIRQFVNKGRHEGAQATNQANELFAVSDVYRSKASLLAIELSSS